jgi:putative hydrolase of the HAD superfamily
MIKPITTLFLDVGGVLLTNGWDHKSRTLAAKKFDLDSKEMESRHNMTFDTYEVGKISLEVYLERVVFYEKRSFSMQQFQEFMFHQSQPFQQMLDLIPEIKKKHGLKVAVVSNEGRELTEYRIKKFKLGDFVDFFICSCFVHIRKPDEDIYRLALDVAQVLPEQVIYIDDRLMFVQVAENLGIRGLHHIDYESTSKRLKDEG